MQPVTIEPPEFYDQKMLKHVSDKTIFKTDNSYQIQLLQGK